MLRPRLRNIETTIVFLATTLQVEHIHVKEMVKQMAKSQECLCARGTNRTANMK